MTVSVRKDTSQQWVDSRVPGTLAESWGRTRSLWLQFHNLPSPDRPRPASGERLQSSASFPSLHVWNKNVTAYIICTNVISDEVYRFRTFSKGGWGEATLKSGNPEILSFLFFSVFGGGRTRNWKLRISYFPFLLISKFLGDLRRLHSVEGCSILTDRNRGDPNKSLTGSQGRNHVYTSFFGCILTDQDNKYL